MASDELKEMRKNLTKEAVRDHQMATTGGTQTDLFTCGKCKGKCCTYTQVRIQIENLFFILTVAVAAGCSGLLQRYRCAYNHFPHSSEYRLIPSVTF